MIQNMITFLLGFVVAMILTIVLSAPVNAQNNWVTCQNLRTGNVQMFPGMSCPPNWAPV